MHPSVGLKRKVSTCTHTVSHRKVSKGGRLKCKGIGVLDQVGESTMSQAKTYYGTVTRTGIGILIMQRYYFCAVLRWLYHHKTLLAFAPSNDVLKAVLEVPTTSPMFRVTGRLARW